jgi:hypothetical protein
MAVEDLRDEVQPLPVRVISSLDDPVITDEKPGIP